MVPGLEERAHLFSKLSSVEQITLGEHASSTLSCAPYPCIPYTELDMLGKGPCQHSLAPPLVMPQLPLLLP